jgi:putative aldouronate transport system substrate-binding protein
MIVRPRMRRAILGAMSISLATVAVATAQDATPLRLFVPQFPQVDLVTNTFTKAVEEKFGLDLTFDITNLDSGPAKERRQIALASGDLPDAFFLIPWVDSFSRPEMLRLAAEGVILPLNALIDQYAPNIKAAFEEVPAYKTLATAPDGNIYGLPQWTECYHCSYGSKLWINKVWLEKLNLKMPTTTEEMRQVLLAFKNNDPNGNGVADEIALTANTRDSLVPFFMNAFIYDPRFSQQYSSTLGLDGQQVVLQAANDKWRDGLRYLASLYTDGVIDPGAFTQTAEGMLALGDNADNVIVGAASMLHPYVLVTGNQPDGRDKNYDAVPPLTGPDGANFATYTLPSSPAGSFVITNAASEAEQVASIKLLDYMFTYEGHLQGEVGSEGMDWRKPEPGEKALDASLTPSFATIPVDPTAPPHNNSWISVAQYFLTATWRHSQVQPDDIYSPAGYERRLFQATDLYAGKESKDQMLLQWNIWPIAEDASELAELQTNIDGFVNQANAEFITGQRDINDDAAWQDYLRNLDELGLPRYLELQQKGYDASPK